MVLDKHILMLSIDQGIWTNGSAVRERMKHYGSLVGSIDIISLGSSNERSVEILSNNVTVYPFSGGKVVALFKALFLTKSLVKENSVFLSQDAFEVGLLASVLAFIYKKPLSTQVHIDFFSEFFRSESIRQKIQSFIAPYVLRRSNKIRVVSAKIAKYLKDELNIDSKKIVIAPIFVDSKKIQESPVTYDLHKKFPQFDRIVLCASRLVKQKNILLAMEAFQMFRKGNQKAGLVILGSGPEKENIERYMRENSMYSCVKIEEKTNEFASAMKTCDVFLLPSDYEGWAMTVIEAASVEKPIIMTDVGCAGEFLHNEKNGLVVPTRDALAMSRSLERYVNEPDFAKNMARAAKDDALHMMTSSEYDILLQQSWNV